MKSFFAALLLLFFSQWAYSTSLIDTLSNSIKFETKIVSSLVVLDANEKQKITRSLVSALPLVQFYKNALVDFSVPAYFAIIPIIESRNQRQAISVAGAVGVWQFMPQTARAYGLRVDSDRDQRQDIVLSTRAAARFLQHLYARYQDPFLVLIAYNWGSGNLDRLLARYPNLTLAQLESRLPQETRSYIQYFISYWSVIHSGQTRDLLSLYPDEPYFTLKNESDCDVILKDQVFNFLNSDNVRGVFCLVPNDLFHLQYKKNLRQNNLHVSKPINKCKSYLGGKFIVYLVRSGDTHKSIAVTLGLDDALQLKILNKSSLLAGTIVSIPKVEHIREYMKSCG